jgi:hypothetical protein
VETLLFSAVAPEGDDSVWIFFHAHTGANGALGEAFTKVIVQKVGVGSQKIWFIALDKMSKQLLLPFLQLADWRFHDAHVENSG